MSSSNLNYIGNTPEEQQEMLRAIGVESLDELLSVIPEQLRIEGLLDIPESISEIEMRALAATLTDRNRSAGDTLSFLGGGAYDHYIPTIVEFLMYRSEFYTAYTPYQPEVSQGTLQAMYEYQSMICELTGMDIANASLYDGGSALGESALMAARIKDKERILISETVSPHHREIVRTYCSGQDLKVQTIPLREGVTDTMALEEMLSDDVAGVLIQSPNYFGIIEPLAEYQNRVSSAGQDSIFVVATHPVSLGILQPPSEFDADIVVAEGQMLGNRQSFGGPYLGVFALKEEFVRKMPGRLVGASVDSKGERGFVLVLKTREQDIRRERATSNICTNQGLNALAAAVYMSSVGKEGIRDVANLCVQKAHYLAERLSDIEGVSLAFNRPFFNEFVLDLPVPADRVIDSMLEEDIFIGIDLGKKYQGYEKKLLVAVTEKRTREELDRCSEAFGEVMSNMLTSSAV